MPKKKKSNLNTVTKASKLKKLKRLTENSIDRAKRLEQNKKRNAASRATENDEQRESRQNYDRLRHVDRRKKELPKEYNARVIKDRERHVESRINETNEQRMTRLNHDKEQHRFIRSLESDEHRAQRLIQDREHHSQSRMNETSELREERLNNDRERHVESRINETNEQRMTRLYRDQEQHRSIRSIESDEHRDQRLAQDREYHSINRELESVEAHENRKKEARERYYSMLNKKEINLHQNQERIAEIRRNESDTQRSERLLADAQQHEINRHLETEEEHEQRLALDRNRQIQRQKLFWKDKINSGYSYNPLIDYKKESYIGQMSIICPDCKALKFKGESKGLCCSSGKVTLDPVVDPPEPIKSLLKGTHAQSKLFLKSIRSYNNAFQMTSFGAKIITEGNFMPTFKVQGQVYHLIGSLLPEENKPFQFLQIYFISDYNEQANVRLNNFQNVNKNLIIELQNCLHHVNPYVRDFKVALESIPINSRNNCNLIINADRKPASAHSGCYNKPSTNEVAVLLVDQHYERRDIILSTRNGLLKRICETHRSYDALQYPLMFCRGEDGYNFGIQTTKKKITALQFYSYRVMVKHNDFNSLHRYKQLLNQFLVDMYAKIESERLLFIRNNQKQLRAENYIHLQDAIQNDKDFGNLGRLVILPSSYTGGPRYMHERTQDGFCYVKKYGRPDLFITFTTNPNWEEITKELYEGQTSSDRHDITSRVFHLKLKKLIDLLTKGQLFGPVKCYMYSVEWQKRGLPHAHCLI
ncbi:uncharacterized protein LOC123274154 [Cotesia glomerata]|uniref:uncharacterized protein LOC123274154 n=1 Tax=Cotesia glomerata TaxID=32391 RepID=UPI001D030A55|nr:uncharacterized protein LOC123274154 [Cotesia glomerata]